MSKKQVNKITKDVQIHKNTVGHYYIFNMWKAVIQATFSSPNQICKILYYFQSKH